MKSKWKELSNTQLDITIAQMTGFNFTSLVNIPNYSSNESASSIAQAAAIKLDPVQYVRNLSLVKWEDAVDPEEVALWNTIEIQSVADLLDASPRHRAEAVYLTYRYFNGEREDADNV